MRRIRVLIVDDSVVVRRIVSDVLARDPDLEVAGVAANGRIALAKIEQACPDIITLDIDMPEMDGLETLKVLRDSRRALPVIMFSTLTKRSAEATLDALALGAKDYVTKPSGMVDLREATEHIERHLIPKIKALGRRSGPADLITDARAGRRQTRWAPSHEPIDVIAVAGSTGGPNALGEIIPRLPPDFAVPVLIVQHMPPLFTRLLAGRLDQNSAIAVREAEAGMAVTPGSAWLAPGGSHMLTVRTGASVRLALTHAPPENSCRPSADVLFRAVANAYGPRALALVLTGMGQDGLRGCEAIAQAGGQIVVQNEQTSVVWGMPGLVAASGLADAILPLGDIATEVIRRVSRRHQRFDLATQGSGSASC